MTYGSTLGLRPLPSSIHISSCPLFCPIVALCELPELDRLDLAAVRRGVKSSPRLCSCEYEPERGVCGGVF